MVTSPPVLLEYRDGLRKALGSSLDRLVLFGSRARGDAKSSSDFDVLCVMNGAFDLGDLMARTSDLTASLSLQHGVVLSRIFARSRDYEQGRLPFFMNVRKEGILVS